FSTGAADATHACCQNCFAIDRSPANQRSQRNENAGRITTWTGDQLRAPDFFPVNLRQTVNRLAQQIRRGMIVTVKFLVNSGVLYPKIRTKIDNARASRQKRLGKFASEPLRECEQDKISLARHLLGVGIGKFERVRSFLMREAREHI